MTPLPDHVEAFLRATTGRRLLSQDDDHLAAEAERAGALGTIIGTIAKAANDLETAADLAKAHGHIGAANALETYIDGLRTEAAWLKRREG